MGQPTSFGPTTAPMLAAPPGFSQPAHHSTAGPLTSGPSAASSLAQQQVHVNSFQPAQQLDTQVHGNGFQPVVGLTATTGQATNLPHAFSTETLRDLNNGAWNMDTYVSSHLNSSVTSLNIVFNTCITGDLYPVTASSPIPHVFLVSQHTWHQRLGHPGGEVLRRLVSSSFILCNKEKPLALCHACQPGKHVRLPFVSSGTVISSCFDIIHSDVWTSHIPSLSVAAGQVRMLHVPSRYQFADIFTKRLPSALFEEFRSSLSVQSLPAPTAREC
ncbi:ribonuclease H-like domain-containing protein [Tanacetum coccineum]